MADLQVELGEGAGNFTKEKWDEMMKLLDKDGDGTVDKEEYEAVYRTMFPGISDEDFAAVWAKIDSDGNGSLDMTELAAYYGFNLESETSAEMTDEQILEALRMQAALIQMNEEKEKVLRAEREAKREAEEVEAKKNGGDRKPKDATIKLVDLEGKTRSGKPDDALAELISFLECCQLGDLVATDPDQPTVMGYLKKGVNVRIECEKGEMPLHKLSRVKLTDRNQADYVSIFNEIVELSRKQAKEAGREGISADINHQDKSGKTPLYLAIEHKNTKLMSLLFGLGKEGPDSLLVNTAGWTVMHSAVNSDDLDTLKSLVVYFTPARTKLLLQTPDKTGREPLHIAAYKCTEEMVQYLMALGSANTRADTAGNTASKLAERAGRRKSREIIEGVPPAPAAP